MSRSLSARPERVLCALAIASLLACGGGAATTTRSASWDSTDAAQVAARATEPRTGDPTAALPPLPASRGSASLTGPSTPPSGGPPASFGAAQPGKSSAPTPAPEASEGKTAKLTSEAAAPTPKRDTAPPKTIGARHVLIQWMGAERAPASVVRSREQAYAVAQQVLKRAKAGEDFARLAIEFSDEPGAGPRGGSLGRFGRGQMVLAFEEAAFRLEVGQISDIVESPFGYHIIQRTE